MKITKNDLVEEILGNGNSISFTDLAAVSVDEFNALPILDEVRCGTFRYYSKRLYEWFYVTVAPTVGQEVTIGDSAAVKIDVAVKVRRIYWEIPGEELPSRAHGDVRRLATPVGVNGVVEHASYRYKLGGLDLAWQWNSGDLAVIRQPQERTIKSRVLEDVRRIYEGDCSSCGCDPRLLWVVIALVVTSSLLLFFSLYCAC